MWVVANEWPKVKYSASVTHAESSPSPSSHALRRIYMSCKLLKTIPMLVIALLVLGLSAGSAMAQDVYKLNYFSNNAAPAPDATIRIDNPGLTYGNLCAMIYVFDSDQQLTECCGCVETHNGLRTLSVRRDLTSNPLTGVISNNGVIKIVSAAVNNSPCDPTANVSPKANLREWATHIQNPVGAAYPITETEFSDSSLGATEFANLQAQCAFVNILGSGHGICSCGTGD
jgi:hypothetical protein